MNPRLLFCSVLPLLLLQACDKSEEKPAPRTVIPPVSEKAAPPAPAPATPSADVPATPATPPAPALTPPTQEEMDAFYASADAFVKEAGPVIEANPELTEESQAPLREKLIALMKTRGKLMRAMTPEQRKAAIVRMAPLIKLQQAILIPFSPHRPAPPEQPGTIPNNTSPPDAPPAAPPPGTPVPPR